MKKEETMLLSQECDAGLKMAISSIDEVLDTIQNQEFKQLSIDIKNRHQKLKEEVDYLLKKYEIKDLGTIECEKIELNAPIKETIELDILSTAVGHFEDTALYNGNVCLAGHNSGTNKQGEDIGFFKRLNELEEGDIITYHHAFGEYIYKVSEIKEIEETDFSVLEPSTTDKLTLITCVKGQKKLRLCVVCNRI